MAGGQALTLSGRGFDDSTEINICDSPCVVQGTPTSSSLTCITPGNAGSGTVVCDVKALTSFSEATAGSQYSYKGSLTPEVTSVSPARGGTAGGTRITIAGSGFG